MRLRPQGCEACAHMAVYYKRVAQRFHDLEIPSLVIARMDLTEETPPPNLRLQFQTLPALVMFPAHDKQPPFRYESFWEVWLIDSHSSYPRSEADKARDTHL